MQQYFFTFLSLFLISNGIFAQQHPTCDGERYINAVFDDFATTTNLKYGENTTIGGNFKELFLDVYEPENDDAETRPLIIFAHGGSFVSGERANMNFLCEDFARRGFVTATIDYRLLDAFVFDSLKIIEEVVMAMSDMKAAVRYFREDAATDNLFKIDTNLIFAGGISAGGLMANHIGFVDSEDDIQPEILNIINNLGGFQGNSSTNTQYSSAVNGILNYSGSLKEAKWVDENDPPIFSVHDDGDNVVPYGNGNSIAFPFGNYMEGSATIKQFADAAGVTNELITIENSNAHVSFFSSNAADYQDMVIQSSAEFLETIVCGMFSNSAEISVIPPSLNLFPNPASSEVTLKLANFEQPIQIAIFNVNGQLVFEKEAISNSLNLNIKEFERGIYFVNISSEQQPIIWKKLVIE